MKIAHIHNYSSGEVMVMIKKAQKNIFFELRKIFEYYFIERKNANNLDYSFL